MSTSPLLDLYDAQMLDFQHDFDVPMNVMVSSEFYPEASMDHDEAYGEDRSVEVDMEEYRVDHLEYEMVDETADVGAAEPLDVEVYDVSIAHSPLPVLESPLLHPLVGPSIQHDPSGSSIPDIPEDTLVPPVTTLNEHENNEVSLAHPEHIVSDAPDSKLLSPQHTSSADVQAEFRELAASSAAEEPLEASQDSSHHEDAAGQGIGFIEQPLPDIVPQQNPLRGSPQLDVGREEQIETAVPLDESHDSHAYLEALAEEHRYQPSDSDVLHAESASHVIPQGTDGTSHSVAEDPTQPEGVDNSLGVSISEGVYIDPPPAVLLSVGSSAEPHCCLFNQPLRESRPGSPSSREDGASATTGYHLLLESSPTLYYEPLSNVFDAFRQDEGLLSQIPHSFEGELVLEAYDLQLALSEDNVHSREISLHDLNILHDGSDFAGPLRLRLFATTPRFIFRYYTLHEQIQRLNLSVPIVEGEQSSDQENPNTGDLQQGHGASGKNEEETPSHAVEDEDQLANRQTEVPDHDGSSLSILTGAVPQSKVDSDYHAVDDETLQALENGEDHEGARVAVRDTDTSAEEVQDVDHAHDLADADHAATTVAEYYKSGGEQADYPDSLPEEYDAHDGEGLQDDVHGDSQFDDTSQYEAEEVGEGDDKSADVNETALADSGPDAVPPLPLRAPLLPKDSPNQQTQNLPTEHDDTSQAEIEEYDDGSSYQSEKGECTAQPGAKFASEPDATVDHGYEADILNLQTAVSDHHTSQADGDEWGWDDDADADADAEGDWPDPDTISNESSVTLSSKASYKRGYEEVDEDPVQELPSTPESKRPRVG